VITFKSLDLQYNENYRCVLSTVIFIALSVRSTI